MVLDNQLRASSVRKTNSFSTVANCWNSPCKSWAFQHGGRNLISCLKKQF